MTQKMIALLDPTDVHKQTFSIH